MIEPGPPQLGDDYDPQSPRSFLPAFGGFLTELRRQIGLTRKDVCEHAEGLPYTTLASIETGERAPTERTTPRIAKGLGVRSTDLWSAWRAFRSANSAPRVAELWSRLLEQGQQTRESREEDSRTDEEIEELLYGRIRSAVAARKAETLKSSPKEREQIIYPITSHDEFSPEILEERTIRIYEDNAAAPSNSALLADGLTQMREQRHLDLVDVARRSGLTKVRLQDIESGEVIPEEDEVRSIVTQGLGVKCHRDWDRLVFTDGYTTRYVVRFWPDTEFEDPRERAFDESERLSLGWSISRLVLGSGNHLSNTDLGLLGLVVERVAVDTRLRHWLAENYFDISELVRMEQHCRGGN